MIVVVPVDPSTTRENVAARTGSRGPEIEDFEASYAASVADVLAEATRSSGEVLVYYRAEAATDDGETTVRDRLESEGLAVDRLRFEPQVGSTRGERMLNAVSHLLEREGNDAVGWLEPTAPLIERGILDGAAMALRRHDVIVAPSNGGSVAFVGFSRSVGTEAIDAESLPDDPGTVSIAAVAADAGLSVGFRPFIPRIDHPDGRVSTRAIATAKQLTGHRAPTRTSAVLAEDGDQVDDLDEFAE